MIVHPITYSFNSITCTVEGTIHIEARNLREAFSKLPHREYKFLQAVDARGVFVYG